MPPDGGNLMERENQKGPGEGPSGKVTSGDLISHYRILSHIGAGGMGEIFLAEDLKLNRRVALKFLPEDCCPDATKKARFLREAQAAAQLSHPNIVVIHEISEYAGRPYFVMEFIEGLDFNEHVKKKNPNLGQIIELANQVSEGLQAAHKSGIIHRDIKPANILVDHSDRIKILDFGLASLKGVENITRTGTTLGTLGYMSPEQLLGEKIDHRSDIYSFGVTLYEIIARQTPFAGEYSAAVMHSILNETPPALESIVPEVPATLSDLISKMIEKNPDLRYQTMEEVNSELKSLAESFRKTPMNSVSDGFPRKTAENIIAVLYFENLFDPDDSKKWGEVISALLISGLTDHPQLTVVSSQRLYDLLRQMGREKQNRIDRTVASQLAHRAGARWMVVGAILAETPFLTISSQVIEVASGKVIAGLRIRGEESETIFSVVDKLLVMITEKITIDKKPLLSPLRPVAEVTTSSPEAYRHYLAGLEWTVKVQEDKAREEFEKALDYDPEFAMAYYSLARMPLPNRLALLAKAVEYSKRATFKEKCYIMSWKALTEDDIPNAINELERLIERHKDEKEAYFSLGVRYHYLGDYEKAISYLVKAISLDPHFERAWNQLAYAYYFAGKVHLSFQTAEQYIRLAPDGPAPYDTQAEILSFAGEADAAIQGYNIALKKGILPSTCCNLGVLYILRTDYEDAQRCFNKLSVIARRHPWVDSGFYEAAIPIHQGNFQKALTMLDSAISDDELDPSRQIMISYKRQLKAGVLMELGKNDEAFEELDKSGLVARKREWFRQGRSLAIDRIWLLARTHRHDEARKELESIGTSSFTPKWLVREDRLIAEGLIAFEEGAYESSYRSLIAANEKFPKWPSIRSFLIDRIAARCCINTGRSDCAIQILSRSLSIYANARIWNLAADVKNHYYLGIAYENTGQTDKAVEQYRTFLNIWKSADRQLPEMADARNRLDRLASGND